MGDWSFRTDFSSDVVVQLVSIGSCAARELIANQSAINLSITYPLLGNAGTVDAAAAATAAAPPRRPRTAAIKTF